jgi:hypothetical protein
VGLVLPNGVELTGIRWYFYDSDATYDPTITLFRFDGIGGFTTPASDDTNSATGGYGSRFFTVNETISNFDFFYVVRVFFPTTGSTNRFGGLRLWVKRQISPAPGTATFNDVPTSHWAFQFIEALADSGITIGCGGSNYCPEDFVTRAQMATFLSRALGLHWATY